MREGTQQARSQRPEPIIQSAGPKLLQAGEPRVRQDQLEVLGRRGRRLGLMERLAAQVEADPEAVLRFPGAASAARRLAKISKGPVPVPAGTLEALHRLEAPSRPYQPQELRGPAQLRMQAAEPLPPPWEAGEDFPSGSTGCGWELVDYVAKLRDPNSVACDGSPLSDDYLAYFLNTTSTSTVVNRGSVSQRMYFQNPSLGSEEALAGSPAPLFPIYATDETPKFAVATVLEFGGPLLGDTDAWWRTEFPTGSEDITELHFSSSYIAFLDADSDGLYTLWAPWLEPSADSDCWEAVEPSYSGSFGRAGWHSTSIPCADASVTFRDVTVLYLPTLGMWLMVAVRCVGDPAAGGNCGSPGADTSLVWFISGDPSFQQTDANEVRGPFALIPEAYQPDVGVGDFVGVPTALIDPDDRHLIVMERDRKVWVCPLQDFEIWALLVAIFSPTFLGDPDFSIGDTTPLILLGPYSTTGSTPSSNLAPTVTDEHLLIDDAGYLQLFFANRYNGDHETDTLDLLSRARSSIAYHPDVLDYILVVREAFEEGTGPAYPVYPVYVLVQQLAGALLTFEMGECDPLCMSELLTGTCEGATQALINDPDVYSGQRAALYAQFHCGPLGGLVYAIAGEAPGFGYTCGEYCTAQGADPMSEAICTALCAASLFLYGYESL